MSIGAPSIDFAVRKRPNEDELSWFAVRQPGVLKLLEGRLSDDRDSLAVGLAAAWRIVTAYELGDGVPAPRLDHDVLARAEYAVIRELAGEVHYEGCAMRQPDLCDFVVNLLQAPPFPLTKKQGRLLAKVLFALVYAIDEKTTGRPVP